MSIKIFNNMRVIYILLALLLFGACKTKEVVKVVPEVHYKDQVQVLKDSVFLHDSVFNTIYARGDTVFVERYKYKYYTKERLKYDTIIVRDSVPYPIEVVKYKTKQSKLAWWLFIISITLVTVLKVRRK